MKRLIVLFLIIPMLLVATQPQPQMKSFTIYVPLVVHSNQGKRGVVVWNGNAVIYQEELRMAHPSWVIEDLAWYKVEPTQGAYNWLPSFDSDYAILQEIGVNQAAILMMAPQWARSESRICGRIAQEHIPDFAEFAHQAALRYPKIHYWLVWNEPDSPTDSGVPPYDHYGCWGNPAEPYFGGAYYATVFNPVQQAIKSANYDAKVYAGGFMMPILDDAQSEYLHGALLAGMSPDGIALHYYTWFSLGNTSPASRVEKIRTWTNANIWITEVSMLYSGQGEPYETAQADFVHYISQEVDRLGLQGYIWFALPDSGWNHSSLMEGKRLKPAFYNFASYDD